MRNILKKLIMSIFSDMRSAVIGIVIASLFGGGVLYLYLKNALHLLKNTLLSPTPLWATIALSALLGLYVYLKIKVISFINHPKDIFNQYYFHPQAGAWIHKTKSTHRVCAKCKIDNIFSRLSLNEKQTHFICPYCGAETPNIPKEIIATSKSVKVIVPMSRDKEGFEFKI